MKYLFSLSILGLFLSFATSSCAQSDKSKRPSPPALIKQKVGNTTVSIEYSQPSVKGRTIGEDLEPKEAEVWRTGANEATIFQVDNDVMINGKVLPKGKYALFTIVNKDNWTIIFNKEWKQWGAFKYEEEKDALRVIVKESKAEPFAEKMFFTIDDEGKVILMWGEKKIEFFVK